MNLDVGCHANHALAKSAFSVKQLVKRAHYFVGSVKYVIKSETFLATKIVGCLEKRSEFLFRSLASVARPAQNFRNRNCFSIYLYHRMMPRDLFSRPSMCSEAILVGSPTDMNMRFPTMSPVPQSKSFLQSLDVMRHGTS